MYGNNSFYRVDKYHEYVVNDDLIGVWHYKGLISPSCLSEKLNKQQIYINAKHWFQLAQGEENTIDMII
jgi:hypothetical protein